MNRTNCPLCGKKCVRNGKTKSDSQRWLCRQCGVTFTLKTDNKAKELKLFSDWLFSKKTQKEMKGEGRTFRRKTVKYRKLWPMPPKIESKRDVLFIDGIYSGRKAYVLICCDEKNVWYLCRYEHAEAWKALMSRIAEPKMAVSD